jgi:protease-4
MKDNDTNANWEQKTLEKLLLATVTEQRRSRRWRNFFRIVILLYIIALPVYWMMSSSTTSSHSGEHSALIEIDDIISADSGHVNADKMREGLEKAYASTGTKGIILRINSPGGSPVQAARIYNNIRQLREEHPDIPVYAVIEDLGASAAYYIAAATDAIYANEASIVGSIGVLINGFGFVDTLDKLGIERRLLSAGEHKALLDPFSPMDSFDAQHAQQLLDEVHAEFINAVKTGRGDRLVDDENLFSGLFWSGVSAKELGLIDGFGDSNYVAKELIGAEKIVDFTAAGDPLDQLIRRLGMGIGEAMLRFSGYTPLQIR